MKNERLSFAYLTWTCDSGGWPILTAVHKSLKAAKANLPQHYREVPTNGTSKRVAQRTNEVNNQIWYVEKHVMMTA